MVRWNPVLTNELLFADEATLAAHNEEVLQWLIDQFSDACFEFELTNRLKKTQAWVRTSAVLKIKYHHRPLPWNGGKNTSPGFTMPHNLSLHSKMNIRFGRESNVMARVAERVWDNSTLTTKAQVRVYQAYMMSTLIRYLCCSFFTSTWTPSFHVKVSITFEVDD